MTLWKCAKRRDVSEYFKKKAAAPPIVQGHPLQTPVIPIPLLALGPFLGFQNPTQTSVRGEIGGIEFSSTGSFEWLMEDGSWIPYLKKDQKLMIEHQKMMESEDKKSQFSVLNLTIEGKTYTLDFKTKTQKNEKSDTVRPFRCAPVWGYHGPLSWSQIEPQSSCELIKVPFGDPAYFSPEVADICRGFRQGNPDYNILSVELVYNPERWHLYFTLREDYRKRVPRFEERYLWHGTDDKSSLLICHQGFKRDLCKNFNYGRGNYFARSPQLASRTEYAKLGVNDTQVLLYCAIAVGDMVVGTKDMRQPPVKDENLLRYENTVDAMGSTKIYVTYDDASAVPLFRLKFKHK